METVEKRLRAQTGSEAIAQQREKNQASMQIHHRLATLHVLPLAVVTLFLNGDHRRRPCHSFEAITEKGAGFCFAMLLQPRGTGTSAESATNAERFLQESLGERAEHMAALDLSIKAGKGIKDPTELATFFANVMGEYISCASSFVHHFSPTFTHLPLLSSQSLSRRSWKCSAPR
jgi:hypothetical protein